MKKLLLLICLCAASCFLQAQTYPNSGYITSTQCVSVPSTNQSTGSYAITGTWTGTVTAYGIVGQGAAVSLGSQTASGSYTASIAGYTLFEICGNTVSTGAAYVLVVASNPASSGAGITITTVAGLASVSGKTNGTIAVVTNGASATDCTSGGGSTVVNCQFNGLTWSQLVGASSGATAFSALTGGTNSSAAMVASGTASLVPSGTGQVATSTNWIPIAPAAIVPAQPTLSFAVGGGTIINVTLFVVVTYVGPTAIVPSGEVKVILSGCSTNCTVTVTMPTSCTVGNLPTGVTGCTVWDGQVAGTELQQASGPACVNITTATCVITTLAAGSALSWPTTTGTNPPNFTAGSITVPDHIINPLFILKGDGNYYRAAGVDVSRLNALPDPMGTFTWTDRFFVNTSGQAPIISNTVFSVHHNAGDGATSNGSGIDDRAVGVEYIIPASTSFTDEQFLTQYNEFNFFSNFTCGPASAENCAAAFRAAMGDQRPANTANIPSGGLGFAGVVGSFQRITTGTSAYGSCTYCVFGVRGDAKNLGSGTGGNQFFVGVAGSVGDNAGSSGFNSAAFVASLGTRFTGGTFGNIAFNADNTWSNVSDWNLKIDGAAKSRFIGSIYVANAAFLANAGTITVAGSISTTGGGSLGTSQFSAPSAPVVTQGGTSGATSYTYAVCYVDGNGGQSCSSTTNTAAGNATLTGTNFNIITIATACGNAAGKMLGPSSANVYRTASSGSPGTTGKIGSISVPADCLTAGANSAFLNDTGLAGDGTTLPANNTTGAVSAYELQTLTNCSGVGTAASPSVASCGSAAAGSFSCATNASAGTCTVNTTAVTAASEIFVTQRTDTTTGTRLGVTCNTTIDTAQRTITAVVVATGFSINLGTIATNPECFSYHIVN